jgi:hypothetical protein
MYGVLDMHVHPREPLADPRPRPYVSGTGPHAL